MGLTKLKARRLEVGILQVSLAQQEGIPRARLSEIECGHVEATRAELERLAHTLEVPTEALRGYVPRSDAIAPANVRDAVPQAGDAADAVSGAAAPEDDRDG